MDWRVLFVRISLVESTLRRAVSFVAWWRGRLGSILPGLFVNISSTRSKVFTNYDIEVEREEAKFRQVEAVEVVVCHRIVLDGLNNEEEGLNCRKRGI